VIHYSPLLPGGYTDRGIALLLLGRNQEALDSFTHAVRVWKSASVMDGLLPIPNLSRGLSGKTSQQITEGHATAYCGLGQSYHRLRQDEQAILEYDQAIQINPHDPNAYIGRGDCHLALGDQDEALADYDEAIRRGPSSARAYSTRGKLLEAMGDDTKALADYDRAIQLDPGFTYALRLRASLLSRRGQNERAIADVEAASVLRPEDAGSLKDRGGVLVRMGQYQRAIDELNKAVELDPGCAAAYQNRGAAYNGLGQYERAVKDLNKAIQLDSTNAGAHTNVGLAYYMMGQYERAIEDLSEAVRLAPKNAIVHMNRGNVYAKLGFREQAVSDYEIATRIDARLMASYGGTERLIESMGRNSLAIRDEKKLALRPDPTALELSMQRGNALRLRGDWPGAIAEFSSVIERDPDRVDAYVARGWARLCSGEPGVEDDARAYLRLKGQRDPIAPYMALLGFLGSRQTGNETSAQTFLNEALESSDQAAWPVPVLRFLHHKITAQALLSAATSSSQQIEAHTFIALEFLNRGDVKNARAHLNWVHNQGISESIAGDLARATLLRLDHPQSQLTRKISEMLKQQQGDMLKK
jgi:tetratricopeptide (TPR) repeat protein